MFPAETPAGIYSGEYNRGTEFPRRGTVYMNYTGGKLINGGENSAENQSSLALTGSTYPVYVGGEEKAVAVAQAVAADFAGAGRACRLPQASAQAAALRHDHDGAAATRTPRRARPAVSRPGPDCEDAGAAQRLFRLRQGLCHHRPVQHRPARRSATTMGLGHTFGKGPRDGLRLRHQLQHRHGLG
jgi:hypothetical protein